jgi:hypothetical protein
MTLAAIKADSTAPGNACQPRFSRPPLRGAAQPEPVVYLVGVCGFVTRGSGMKVTVYISRAVRYRQP